MVTFCDLEALVENKELVSTKCEDGKWRSMEYETKLGEGKLLVAAQEVFPQPLALNLSLDGWYKIYIGLFHFRIDNYSLVRLSDDEAYTPVKYMPQGSPHNWCLTEYMQEVYWKCADLTGQKLILGRTESLAPCTSGLAWIRCEEMSEEEVIRYQKSKDKMNKCVQMHFDCDPFIESRSYEQTEHIAKLHMLNNTNMDFGSMEYAILYDNEISEPHLPLRKETLQPIETKRTYDEMLQLYLAFAQRNNLKFYATERMSLANFYTPYSFEALGHKNFISKHPEYYCKNRDGSTVAICSYAYKEVQDYVLEQMVRMIKMGFAGISMIYHRGICIGFEQPVEDRFKELYPDTDMYLLPLSDERLRRVRCEFITNFMRRIRETLDAVAGKHVGINVIVDYGLESSKNFGLDVETWAKEGLIDSASQADMETYEDLTDCMSDVDGQLIDMEKYKKRMEDFHVIKRNYCTNLDKICQHMPEYLKLEEKYGIQVYHVLPWVHTVLPEKYMEMVEIMQNAGAKRFLAWNTNHMLHNLPEYHQATSIGNDMGVDGPLRKFYKVLSLDNNNISQVITNWRG